MEAGVEDEDEDEDERRFLLWVSELRMLCYLSGPYPHSLHDVPE